MSDYDIGILMGAVCVAIGIHGRNKGIPVLMLVAIGIGLVLGVDHFFVQQ